MTANLSAILSKAYLVVLYMRQDVNPVSQTFLEAVVEFRPDFSFIAKSDRIQAKVAVEVTGHSQECSCIFPFFS